MSNVCVDTECSELAELVCKVEARNESRYGGYEVDMWREVRRRWMAGGVLFALLAAVLRPALGAPGGPLHTQYLWFLPLSYIYYSAGVRAGAGWGGGGAARGRVLAVSCAHAALLTPALALLLLAAAPPAAPPHPLLHGLVLAGAGGGCAWLSLAVSAHEAAPLLTALNYLASLLTAPAAMLLLCGRATVPPVSGVAGTLAGAVPAFLAGAARGGAGGGARAARGGRTAARACACALLYVQCCEGLAAHGGGPLPPADLLAALLAEAGWLCASAGACWAYARSGLLSAGDARLVAACALPRGPHAGWWCAGGALARLPAVFLAPAQALLLAALPEPH